MSLPELISRFEANHNELDRVQKISKELRKTKIEILEGVKIYMERNGLKELKFGNFAVKLNKPKPKQKKLSKDEIEEVLESIMRPDNLNKVIDKLFTEGEEDNEIPDKLTLKKVKTKTY